MQDQVPGTDELAGSGVLRSQFPGVATARALPSQDARQVALYAPGVTRSVEQVTRDPAVGVEGGQRFLVRGREFTDPQATRRESSFRFP